MRAISTGRGFVICIIKAVDNMNPTPTELVLKNYKLPFVLRQDQIETIDYLAQFSKTGCFYPIGSGKTVVGTALALYHTLLGNSDCVLVLMPPILLEQWFTWLDNFEGITKILYSGSVKQRSQMVFDCDFTLMSYDIFKRDHAKILEAFKDKKLFVIADEASKFRRIDTLLYRAVRDLISLPDKYVTMMTGSPIGVSLAHAYSYISLKTPDVYGSWPKFVLCHISAVDGRNNPVAFKNVEFLKDSLMLRSIYRDSADILNLPPITFDTVEYSLEPKHQKLYDKIVEEKLLVLDDGKILDGTVAQRLYHTCQRVILQPAEFGGDKITPKAFKLIDSMLENVSSNEKLIVYVNYQTTNEAVYNYVKGELKLGCLQAYGKTGAAQNRKNVDTFLKDEKIRVLIANPDSIGIGLNLQECHLILFLELPITADVWLQAIGRIAREGQKHPCLVRMAQAKHTIQVFLRKNVLKKEGMAQQLIPTKVNLRVALRGA